MTHTRWFGFLLIILSALSFGALGIFARLAYQAGSDPPTVLFLRFVTAGLMMMAIMGVRRLSFPRGRALLHLILLGAIGYVGQSLSYFTALSLASASLVALILYIYPALVTILAALVLRERLQRLQIAALLLALTGSFLTIGPAGRGQPLGIALAVIAAVIYAVYIVAGSRLIPRGAAISSSTTVMLSAAVVYTGLIAIRGPVYPTTLTGWAAIAGVALISTVLAISAFFAGLERIGPTNAALLSTLEPAMTVVLAALILHERINPTQLLGGGLILAAVVVLSRS